jgi:capsular exopolysaccharide synthesis family protein
MSKIFDALRKAEQEPVEWIAPTAEPDLRQELPPHARDLRILETEFGRLSSAVQSSFTKFKDGRVVLVVGAVRREGGTFVAAQLGRALATDCGGPVLALDADFHDPKLAKQLNAKSGLGITDVYQNGGPPDLSEVIQRGDVENLYLLTPGKRRISPVSFFDSTQFDGLLTSVRRTFRFTIVDGPPLLAHPDALHLAARVDGVILVVRHSHLKREVLQKAVSMLESVRAPILGAVLNRRKFAIPNLVYRFIS